MYTPLYAKNNAKAVLISDNTSTLTVDSTGYTLPTDVTNGKFHITVDNEIMRVDSITDNTSSYELDITRPVEGTSLVIHSADTTAYMFMTAYLYNDVAGQVSTNTTKLDYLTVTQEVDLDTLESNVATNNAKVSNATHTGDVTGSVELTIAPEAISDKTEVTAVAGDYLLLWDATDSSIKKANASDFTGSGGGGSGLPTSSSEGALLIADASGGWGEDDRDVIISNGLTVGQQARHSANTALDTSGTITWDIQQDPKANIVSPTDNITLNFSNVELNSEAVLYFVQDSSSAASVTWDSNIIWSGGFAPDLSTLSSKHVISFYSYDGTGLMGVYMNDTEVVNGLYNVLDTTSDKYYIGSVAVANQQSWGSYFLLQMKNNFSIHSANSTDVATSISQNLYLDSSGLNTYTSASDGQRITFNGGDTEFWYSDGTVHVADDLANVYKRVQIGYGGFSIRNDAGTLVFNVDVTGNITAVGSVDGRDISALGTKLDYITVTQAVDLDTLESNVATNNAKVTNATHTGEVTGSGALTIDPTAISGKTGVTPVSGDYLLLWDATDSSLKKSDASTFLLTGSAQTVTGAKTFDDGTILLAGATSGYTNLKGDTSGIAATVTLPKTTCTLMGLETAQTVTGVKTFDVSTLVLNGATSGTTTLNSAVTAGTSSITFPSGTDTVVCTNASQLLTNKRIQPRVETISDSTGGITFNADDYDAGTVTIQANRVLNAPSGTPYDYQTFALKIVQGTGGNKTISSVNSIYNFGDSSSPPALSTTEGTHDILLFMYDAQHSKWNYLSQVGGF